MEAYAGNDIRGNAGFKEVGKTPLNTRVHSELFRMQKRGLVVKTEAGYMLQTRQ